ncbi:hypothetical protein GE09DRAFT_1232645 [Coniochaeta sp. 2T2.1]|nr:hypothetical protein GE09DRAFT_1232645 [Coniochaeta sp. 2T2.1]
MGRGAESWTCGGEGKESVTVASEEGNVGPDGGGDRKVCAVDEDSDGPVGRGSDGKTGVAVNSDPTRALSHDGVVAKLSRSESDGALLIVSVTEGDGPVVDFTEDKADELTGGATPLRLEGVVADTADEAPLDPAAADPVLSGPEGRMLCSTVPGAAVVAGGGLTEVPSEKTLVSWKPLAELNENVPTGIKVNVTLDKLPPCPGVVDTPETLPGVIIVMLGVEPSDPVPEG